MIGKNGPSDSARAAARGGRLRRPAAARHAARCASRALCSGGAPRRYPPSLVTQTIDFLATATSHPKVSKRQKRMVDSGCFDQHENERASAIAEPDHIHSADRVRAPVHHSQLCIVFVESNAGVEIAHW